MYQLDWRVPRTPGRKMTDIYVDGDACPVREEIYRVAARLRLNVFVVSNGSRPIRPPGDPNVSMVLVGDNADAADDWIAERIAAVDVASPPIFRWRHAASRMGRASSPRPEEVGRTRISAMRSPVVRSPGTCGKSGPTPAASPVDPEGQVPVPRRARYGRAGCIARGGPELNQFLRRSAA